MPPKSSRHYMRRELERASNNINWACHHIQALVDMFEVAIKQYPDSESYTAYKTASELVIKALLEIWQTIDDLRALL